MKRLGRQPKVDQTAEQRSVAILQKIHDLVKEYSKVLDDSGKETEIMTKQAIVCAVWCPEKDLGFEASVGHSLLCDGLLKNLNEDRGKKMPSLSDMFPGL